MPDHICSEEPSLSSNDICDSSCSCSEDDSLDTSRHGVKQHNADIENQPEHAEDHSGSSPTNRSVSCKSTRSNDARNDGSFSSHLRSEMATLQHWDPRHLHIRDQADMLSRIPGLNLFIRPYEELTTTHIESMLRAMEGRILERIDGAVERLDERLDAMEKRLDTLTKYLNDGADSGSFELRNRKPMLDHKSHSF